MRRLRLPDRRTTVAIAAAIACCASIATLAQAIPWRVAGGDIAEAETVPYILGIAHPTGFPAFTLLGWLFSHVVAVSTVAWRMNAFTSVCVALTAGGVVLLAGAVECNVFAALAAAFVFAFGAIVRSEAVYASAQGLAGMFMIFALVASIWYAKHGDRRALIGACAGAGFGLATHPVAIWVLPGIAVAIGWQWRTLTRRTVAFAGIALIAPLILYLYFPIRSGIVAAQHLDPTAAAPIFAVGTIDWDTSQPRTLTGFLNEVLARKVYASRSLQRSMDVSKIPAAAAFWFPFAVRQYRIWVLVLAAIGIIALAQRERRALSVIVAGTAGGMMFAAIYRFDASVYWYLLVSFAVTAALAASATRLKLPYVHPRIVPAGVTLVLAVTAFFVWSDDRNRGGIPHQTQGESIIESVAHDIPDGAIIVAPWYEAQALGYGASVEHALGSRIIVAGWPGDFVAHYPAWSRARRLFIYAGGMELMSAGSIPRYWFRELPTSNRFYRVLELVIPR